MLQLLLAAALLADAAAAAPATVEAGAVTLTLCREDIIRVQAAGPPPGPPPGSTSTPAWVDMYSGKLLDNAVCSADAAGEYDCPANMPRGGYDFVRSVAAPVAAAKDCAANYPKGECEPLFYFYSADNNDNTVARNISRPGYTQVSGGANASGHVAGYVSRVSGDGLVPLKLWWCE